MKLNFRRIWHISLVVAMLVFVASIAIDTKDVNRYAHRMERMMQSGDYQGALAVGDRSDKTDLYLLKLRIEALAHEHELGERLFSYPVKGWSHELKKWDLDLKGQGGDLELCAYLIDKDLDGFVKALPQYYEVNGQLPRYYREALIQYNHMRSAPAIVYHDNVLDTDYRDLQELEKQYANPKARQVAVFRQYEGTYWYYYDYMNQHIQSR